MTTLTPTRLAQMPRVNLLPPEIAAEAKLKRLKVILGLTVLAVMALLVLAFLWVSGQVGSAEEELATAQTDGQRAGGRGRHVRRSAARCSLPSTRRRRTW